MKNDLIEQLEDDIQVAWSDIKKLYYDGFFLGNEIDLQSALFYILQRQLIKKYDRIRVIPEYYFGTRKSDETEEKRKTNYVDLCIVEFKDADKIDINASVEKHEHQCLIGIEVKKGRYNKDNTRKWQGDYKKLKRLREKKGIKRGYFAFIETSPPQTLTPYLDELENMIGLGDVDVIYNNSNEEDYEFYREAQGNWEKNAWKIVKPDDVHATLMSIKEISELFSRRGHKIPYKAILRFINEVKKENYDYRKFAETVSIVKPLYGNKKSINEEMIKTASVVIWAYKADAEDIENEKSYWRDEVGEVDYCIKPDGKEAIESCIRKYDLNPKNFEFAALVLATGISSTNVTHEIVQATCDIIRNYYFKGKVKFPSPPL